MDQLLLSRSHLNYGLLQNHQGCQYGSSSIKMGSINCNADTVDYQAGIKVVNSNPVDAATGALIGSGIRTDPEKTGGKEVTITLSSAQKAGRTTKPRGTKRKQIEVEIGG